MGAIELEPSISLYPKRDGDIEVRRWTDKNKDMSGKIGARATEHNANIVFVYYTQGNDDDVAGFRTISKDSREEALADVLDDTTALRLIAETLPTYSKG